MWVEKGAGLLMPNQRGELQFWVEVLPSCSKWSVTDQGHGCVGLVPCVNPDMSWIGGMKGKGRAGQ